MTRPDPIRIPVEAAEPNDKVQRANALLAEQRAGLEMAVGLLSVNPLDRLDLDSARRMLVRVGEWERDLRRSPDLFAPLVLGFMGDNGWAPLIRQICHRAAWSAEQEKVT